jgi:nucleobase:cation symporter-1, NCS1 family
VPAINTLYRYDRFTWEARRGILGQKATHLSSPPGFKKSEVKLEHPVALGIESHSIDFVPEDERHGRVTDQGLFWFVSNFQFFAIAIGFVGPSLGLSLGYTALGGAIGILIGTTFQAFHASQGPEMGLPQMIQSRAQFGYRGVIVPLLATLVSVIGYNVVATVLAADGVSALWGLSRGATAVTVSLAGCALAIWGYDWLHRAFRILFWISLPLFAILTLAIATRHVGGPMHATGGFSWAAFGTQLASAASFNIGSAPYVSDYSRYLRKNTSRRLIILNVFAGSALSAIWLIALGAWLAARLGMGDGLLALRVAGNQVHPGFGSLLALTSVAALVASIGMNAYSGMLTIVTAMDSLRPIRPTRSVRIVVLLAQTVFWGTCTVWLDGNSISYVNGLLVLMLYFLMPWTAVNLVDYFWLRRGNYSIPDLFRPDGIYGNWGKRGLVAYAVGFVVSVPFFVIPNGYTGVLATRLGGVDIGWLVGGCVAAIAYLFASTRFSAADELAAIQGSARALNSSPATQVLARELL